MIIWQYLGERRRKRKTLWDIHQKGYSEYDSPGYRGVRGYKEGEEEGGEDG